MEAILAYLFGGLTVGGLSLYALLLVCSLLASWGKDGGKDKGPPTTKPPT